MLKYVNERGADERNNIYNFFLGGGGGGGVKKVGKGHSVKSCIS